MERIRILLDRMIIMVVAITIGMNVMADLSSSSFDATGPYLSPAAHHLYLSHTTIMVLSPSYLVGSFVVSINSLAGPIFINRTNMTESSGSVSDNVEQLIRVRLIVPHSDDDPMACMPLQHSFTDEDEPVAGSLLLIQRGVCAFSDKLDNVAPLKPLGVLFANLYCSSLPSFVADSADSPCGSPSLISIQTYRVTEVPSLLAQAQDAAKLRDYIESRRQASRKCMMLTSNVTETPKVNISCLPTNLQNSIEVQLFGSDATSPSDIAALRSLGRSLQIPSSDPTDPNSWSYLSPWTEFNADPNWDPCLQRIAGIWCEGGRVVMIDLSVVGVSGVIPAEFGNLTALRTLLLPSNPSLSPNLPSQFCNLSSLRALVLQDCSFQGLPACLGSLTNLRYLEVTNNPLGRLFPLHQLPYLLDLRYLDLQQTELDGSLPFSFLLPLVRLQEVYLGLNPNLRLPVDDDWRWSNHTKLQMLLLPGTRLEGVLPVDAFDFPLSFGSSLVTLDLSSTCLSSGPLPNLLGCYQLRQLSLGNNTFEGSVPSEWSSSLKSLMSVDLHQNRISGDLIPLGVIPQLSVIDVAHNSISMTSNMDFGDWIAAMIPSQLVEIHLDYNQLNGEWTYASLMISTRHISLSHNRILSLPADLFQYDLQTFDASYNQLSGPMPSGAPQMVSIVQPDKRVLAWSEINLIGNPQLVGDPLPIWIVPQFPIQYSTSFDGLYQCLNLVGSEGSLTVSVDPTFTGYRTCVCARAAFGHPPNCFNLPLAATLRADLPPICDEIGIQFAQLIQQPQTIIPTQTSTNLSSMEYLVGSVSPTTVSSNSEPASVVAIPSDFSWHPFSAFPTLLTDGWYGNQRFAAGVNTIFIIDLAGIYGKSELDVEQFAQVIGGGKNTTTGAKVVMNFESARGESELSQSVRVPVASRPDGDSESDASLFCGDANTPQLMMNPNATSSSASSVLLDLVSACDLRPVVSITLRVHIDRKYFRQGSTLSIFEYEPTQDVGGQQLHLVRVLDGGRPDSMLPTDEDDKATAPTGLAASPAYQQAYGAALASFQDPILLTARVLSPRAQLTYSSRDESGTHFLATYSFAFRCPIGYDFDDSSQRCIAESGGRTPVLLLVLIISGILLCGAVGLVILERWKRQKSRASRVMMTMIGARGGINSDDHSIMDDPTSVQQLQTMLRHRQHRALLREFVVECVTLVVDATSLALNWSVTAQGLQASISAAHIISMGVVLVSTVAFVFSVMSRSLLLRFLRTEIRLRYEEVQIEQQRLVTIKQQRQQQPSGEDSDLLEDPTLHLLQLRRSLSVVEGALMRHSISLASLCLHSVPWLCFHLYQLQSVSDDLTADRTRLASIILALLTTGYSLRTLALYPQLKAEQTQLHLEMTKYKRRALQMGKEQIIQSQPEVNGTELSVDVSSVEMIERETTDTKDL